MNKPQSPRRPRGRGPKRNKPMGGGNSGSRIDSRGRGNPKQLLEKFKTQARDALQSGDRVLAEYYFQFADHYQRVVNERFGVSVAEDEDGDEDDDEDEGYAPRFDRHPSRTERAELADADRADRRRPYQVPEPAAENDDHQRGRDNEINAGSEDGEPAQLRGSKRRRRNRPDRPETGSSEAAGVVDVVDDGGSDGSDSRPLVIATEVGSHESEPPRRRRRRQPEEPVA